MRVILAGYNTDVENSSATPETISAAYARISRDPAPVDQLRRTAAAEVKSARKSNRTIVFKYGHGSIAEHAVFNFDILGISRLAVEALQSFRLTSFTEKSQRYIRIGEDWHLPEGFTAREEGMVNRLFQAYGEILEKLDGMGISRTGSREDARYILPLATTSQMGMTVNARELEHMIRRLSAHPLKEVRDLGKALYRAVMPVAPSLMIFTEPSEMDRIAHMQPTAVQQVEDVVLLECDDDSRVSSWLRGISGASDFQSVYSGLGVHDALPRCWELFRADFRVNISATAYAQLKRHRMSTQLVTGYEPSLGITVPPVITEAGLEEMFRKTADMSADLASELGLNGDYLLTNAHRRQVRICINGRELNHFSRLREDEHAQWDIRKIACRMTELVREKAPETTRMTCGKSQWEELTGRSAE
ncbi:hypothetical protein CSA37_12995 [Candidatus Fermentibacteria bacterium]|nr:MAG: hypothetical protein CSA37_12995 [Candidatus Fermentibacteria bacterium]